MYAFTDHGFVGDVFVLDAVSNEVPVSVAGISTPAFTLEVRCSTRAKAQLPLLADIWLVDENCHWAWRVLNAVRIGGSYDPSTGEWILVYHADDIDTGNHVDESWYLALAVSTRNNKRKYDLAYDAYDDIIVPGYEDCW